MRLLLIHMFTKKRKRYQGCTRTEWQPHRVTTVWRGNKRIGNCKPRRQASRKPNLPTPWYWTCSLQNEEKIHFCCLRTQSVMFGYGSRANSHTISFLHQTANPWILTTNNTYNRDMRNQSKWRQERMNGRNQKQTPDNPQSASPSFGTPGHKEAGTPVSAHLFFLWNPL